MSNVRAPADFNPEEADNLEDVIYLPPFAGVHSLTTYGNTRSKSSLRSKVSLPCTSNSPRLPHNPNGSLNTDVRTFFRVKAVQHMSTYWGILEKMRGSKLRLTRMDDDIYEHLKTDFPEFDPAETIDEDKMKSKSGKERWRKFMMAYEKKVDDYNFGTLLRSNPKFEYGEKETIFVPRMQFYAIEIARNRAGLNDWIYEREHPDE